MIPPEWADVLAALVECRDQRCNTPDICDRILIDWMRRRARR